MRGQQILDLLEHGRAAGATHIHLEPIGMMKYRVRHLVDGELVQITPPVAVGQPIVSGIKKRAGMDVAERREAQVGQIVLGLDDGGAETWRVSSSPGLGGEALIIRVPIEPHVAR
jgi:type IV pilus assembly protein PilB